MQRGGCLGTPSFLALPKGRNPGEKNARTFGRVAGDKWPIRRSANPMDPDQEHGSGLPYGRAFETGGLKTGTDRRPGR